VKIHLVSELDPVARSGAENAGIDWRFSRCCYAERAASSWESRVGADANWDTYAILQDNSYEHFVFSQFNSTLVGSGVNVLQPPFATLPTRIELDIGSPTGGSGSCPVRAGGKRCARGSDHGGN
jgi:hypothetical protein